MTDSSSPFEYLYQEELYVLPGQTIVLIDRPWVELSDDERLLLQKILGSVKLTLAQVSILHQAQVTLDALRAINAERVISFGARVIELQAPYQLTMVGEIPVIGADSLRALDDAKKKSLWLALRQMFKI